MYHKVLSFEQIWVSYNTSVNLINAFWLLDSCNRSIIDQILLYIKFLKKKSMLTVYNTSGAL